MVRQVPESIRCRAQRKASSVGSGSSLCIKWPIVWRACCRHRYGSKWLRIISLSASENLNHENLFCSTSYSSDSMTTTIGNIDAWIMYTCSSNENVRKPANKHGSNIYLHLISLTNSSKYNLYIDCLTTWNIGRFQ